MSVRILRLAQRVERLQRFVQGAALTRGGKLLVKLIAAAIAFESAARLVRPSPIYRPVTQLQDLATRLLNFTDLLLDPSEEWFLPLAEQLGQRLIMVGGLHRPPENPNDRVVKALAAGMVVSTAIRQYLLRGNPDPSPLISGLRDLQVRLKQLVLRELPDLEDQVLQYEIEVKMGTLLGQSHGSGMPSTPDSEVLFEA